MFVAFQGMKDQSWPKMVDLHVARTSNAHVDVAVQHDEHLRTVVDVPVIGRVGPVQPNSCLLEVLDGQRLPGLRSAKARHIDDSHLLILVAGLPVGRTQKRPSLSWLRPAPPPSAPACRDALV